MSGPTQQDVGKLTEAINRLSDRAEKIPDAPVMVPLSALAPPPVQAATVGNMSFTINAGGWATMIACAVAVLCLALQMQSQFRQSGIDAKQDADTRELRAEQRRADDYQNMLWRAYPELRESSLKAREEPKK